MSQSGIEVICLGECLIDLIADPGHDLSHAGSLTIREGGAPMNVAVGLARLGVPSAMCSVVGRDPFGDRLLSLLRHERVDTTGVRQTSDADTTIAYAWRDDRGDGRFRIVRLADRLLDGDDVVRIAIVQATAIVVGSVALSAQPSRRAIEHAVELAVEQRMPIVFDVNVRPTLWANLGSLREACEPILRQATVVKLSLDDAIALWGYGVIDDVQQRLAGIATSASVVVVTDGGRATWVRRGMPAIAAWSRHEVFTVDAVEPTGAGDAFTAALVSRLLAHDWRELTDADIRFAMAAGAITTTKPGAISALPTISAIEHFLASRLHP